MSLLQDAVRAQAQARPGAIAVVGADGRRLTYGALEQTSNRLARLLADAGCRRGDRVALLMPKHPAAIVAMLGVLKADAIYVPLDPAGPAARLARMLEISDCRAVLAAGAVQDMLRDALGAARLAKVPAIGWLDADPPPAPGPVTAFGPRELASYAATAPASANTEDDLAHILFTSGSTGLPKGVMIAHRSVLRFIRWASAYFRTAPGERISQHPPFHFDLSTFDIYGTLSAGAELHLVPPEFNLLPHKLARFIRDARLTQWFSVPAALTLMAKFDVVKPGAFPALRRVLWAGEAIPTPTLIYWMRRVPRASFTNLYGPTETTIASSYYTVPRCPDDPRAPVPIGTACEGEELLVLDAERRPVPAGTLGELYIGGAGLSPGYWRDLDKTRAAFLPRPSAADPADRLYRTGDLGHRDAGGLFHFAGRADSQIKSRGYRIELGEIEAALNAHRGLQESAVVAIPSDGFEGSLICCAYVPARNGQPSAEALRRTLAGLLPPYMLPARWMRWEALPKNVNGKIDRPRLRSEFERAEAHAPQAERRRA
jgi:amino acid adenylation domain-containing protein